MYTDLLATSKGLAMCYIVVIYRMLIKILELGECSINSVIQSQHRIRTTMRTTYREQVNLMISILLYCPRVEICMESDDIISKASMRLEKLQIWHTVI